jgi:hypothetical protein
MHQEKIEFPKFTVPGQTNWVKWVLVGVGGLVVLSACTFAVALATRNQAPAVVAVPAKPVDVPLAPSATPKPVPQRQAALAATSTTPAETAAASDDAPAAAKPASRRPRRSHGHAKSLAKASSGSTAAASQPGKPDAIDELLKRFK